MSTYEFDLGVFITQTKGKIISIKVLEYDGHFPQLEIVTENDKN